MIFLIFCTNVYKLSEINNEHLKRATESRSNDVKHKNKNEENMSRFDETHKKEHFIQNNGKELINDFTPSSSLLSNKTNQKTKVDDDFYYQQLFYKYKSGKDNILPSLFGQPFNFKLQAFNFEEQVPKHLFSEEVHSYICKILLNRHNRTKNSICNYNKKKVDCQDHKDIFLAYFTDLKKNNEEFNKFLKKFSHHKTNIRDLFAATKYLESNYLLYFHRFYNAGFLQTLNSSHFIFKNLNLRKISFNLQKFFNRYVYDIKIVKFITKPPLKKSKILKEKDFIIEFNEFVIKYIKYFSRTFVKFIR